eukprot:s3758_g10.t2
MLGAHGKGSLQRAQMLQPKALPWNETWLRWARCHGSLRLGQGGAGGHVLWIRPRGQPRNRCIVFLALSAAVALDSDYMLQGRKLILKHYKVEGEIQCR